MCACVGVGMSISHFTLYFCSCIIGCESTKDILYKAFYKVGIDLRRIDIQLESYSTSSKSTIYYSIATRDFDRFSHRYIASTIRSIIQLRICSKFSSPHRLNTSCFGIIWGMKTLANRDSQGGRTFERTLGLKKTQGLKDQPYTPKSKNLAICEGLDEVGMVGYSRFELLTSSMSRKRSNQLS